MSHHFVRYTNLSYSYQDGTKALDNINLEIRHGEKVALLGLNGSGKSTLLLLTDALMFSGEGEINIGDVPVNKKTASLIQRCVGLVFQDPDDMLFMPTVYDDVAFGPRNMNLPEQEIDRRVKESLQSVGLEKIEERPSYSLSGGQRRAAAIATVLSMEPDILLLDEPSANLDGVARRNLIRILENFHHTMIIATHDLDLAGNLCDRAVILDKGKVISDEKIEDYREFMDKMRKFNLI